MLDPDMSKNFSFSASFLLITLMGCSHAPITNSASTPQCLDDNNIKTTLPQVEDFLKKISSADGVPTPKMEAVDDVCWKRKYVAGAYDVLIYRDPETKVVKGTVALSQPAEFRRQCFSQALDDLQTGEPQLIKNLLQMTEKKAPEIWRDEDLGPVHWVACANPREGAYFDSLGLLLQELNQSLHNSNCIFVSSDNQMWCFSFQLIRPVRTFAKLNLNFLSDPRIKKSAELVQGQLIDDQESERENPLLLLLQETQGFALATENSAALLKIRGVDPVYPNPEKPNDRSYRPLPQVMNTLALYLQKLRDSRPEIYIEIMEKPKDRLGMQKIFHAGEWAYEHWEKALKGAGKTSFPAETEFWQEYQKIKATLQPIFPLPAGL